MRARLRTIKNKGTGKERRATVTVDLGAVTYQKLEALAEELQRNRGWGKVSRSVALRLAVQHFHAFLFTGENRPV